MIDFSLQHILKDSPYDITLSEAGFIFQTDNGIHYCVSFDEEEIVLGGCKTYQFILYRVENVRAPHDPKIEDTVLAIINDNRNPNIQAITADFNETAKALSNKP
jgi:hypothetical protein